MFTFMNSVDPGEMLHNAAFHLGLDCLGKYMIKGSPYIKGYRVKLTHKALPIICRRQPFQILLLFQKYHLMRIVCWQTIFMKYHSK